MGFGSSCWACTLRELREASPSWSRSPRSSAREQAIGSRPLHSGHSPQLWLQWMTTSSPTFQRRHVRADLPDDARRVGAGDVEVVALCSGRPRPACPRGPDAVEVDAGGHHQHQHLAGPGLPAPRSRAASRRAARPAGRGGSPTPASSWRARPSAARSCDSASAGGAAARRRRGSRDALHRQLAAGRVDAAAARDAVACRAAAPLQLAAEAPHGGARAARAYSVAVGL